MNTSVTALQAVLAVYEAYVSAESDDLEQQAREDLINQTVIHAVAADPSAFTDDENWWSQTFLEIEFSSARILLGEQSLFQLVTQDAAGRWGVDHPGYEDDE
ncbi:SUKH-4 family immunity protein [Actinospica robiniae]|uniref:SUKH-4 family immunity protein n=1 Tax=Actinospica robiniae TaxID=304901 RepID=UPI003CCB9F6B